MGTLLIHSCRVAPIDFGDVPTWRDPDVTAREVRGIKAMLDSIGLDHVEVWTRPYKPPADFYVDDKAIRFDGSWPSVVAQVEILGPQEDAKDEEHFEVCPIFDDSCPGCPEGQPCARLAGDSEPSLLKQANDHVRNVKDILMGCAVGPTKEPEPERVSQQELDDHLRKFDQAVRHFETGATRNVDNDQLDYEAFLSPLVLKRFGEYMHKHRFQSDGTLRDGDNWQKGIPLDSFMKSGYRHFMDWWLEHRGHESREGLEEAICALLFNAMGYLHETLKEKT